MNYRDEMEIDLLDLLYVILNRWRSIVVFMILGALAGGIFSYFKPETVNSASASQVNIITAEELNDLQSKLDKKLTEEASTFVKTSSVNFLSSLLCRAFSSSAVIILTCEAEAEFTVSGLK